MIKGIFHNKEVEQAILGAVFVDDTIFSDMTDLTERDFYLDKNKFVFRAMKNNYNSKICNDFTTVSSKLNEMKLFEKSGGINYLLELGDNQISISNFSAYKKLLVDASEERRIEEKLQIFIRDRDKFPLEDRAEWIIDNIKDRRTIDKFDFNDIADEMEDYITYLETPDTGEIKETLYQNLDRMLSIRDTDLITIAGRPGSGKSCLALNFANHWCMQGHSVSYISLEMDKKQLKNRLFSNLSSIENRDLKNKTLSKDEWMRLIPATQVVKNDYKLNIYDKSLTVEHLVNYAKVLKKNNKLDILILDHALLLDTQKKINNRAQQVNYISWKLKQLAMDLKIPVIMVTQLGRGSEKENRRPNKSDLKESGGIEENSNAIILLYNKSSEKSYDNDFIDVIIEKNRDGETGVLYYTFNKPFQRFIEKGFKDGKPYEIPLKEFKRKED